MTASPDFEVPFAPVLSHDEGGKFMEAIYSLDDPDYWCLWQSTVLALEHFKGNKAWWPSRGLLAHQLEWRAASAFAISGDENSIRGHEVGLNLVEEHLRAQGIAFAAQYVVERVADRSKLDWHGYMPVASVDTISEDMLPGLIQFTGPNKAHMEFLLDLSETGHLDRIANLGHEAVRVTKLAIER